MRISKIVCDVCGKEIHGEPIRIFAEKVDRDTGDIVDDSSVYAPGKDFCEKCFNNIKNFIDSISVALAEEDKPVMEEPAPEEIKEPPVEVEKEVVEVEEPKQEHEPKQEPEPKKETKPASSKESKNPTIRDLVLQGLSKEEVCRKTGCKPITYDQTKYQLRKKGLLPEKAEKCSKETVKCSEVHDTCKYAGKDKQCDYILTTNKMRGCPLEACDKYEKK